MSRIVLRARPRRGPKSVIRSVPAPVGGWNARDSIDEMRPDEAISLVNWFPAQGECVIRGGSAQHATGLGGAVETVGEFNAGTSRKLFAAANNNIWDATTAGAATSLASGFTNDRWQWAQFDDASGGARVGLVNGADAPQIYNGSAVSAMTISGSGLTPANLDGINIFKNRSYFWDTDTQDFWYSATNALGGALTKFPLGRVAGTGGNLIAMGTWTRDGGSGPDDLAVFVLSSGDVFVYSGDNPGDSTAWGLVGAFKIGAPLGVRALTKYGGDLIIATKNGYVPLSKVLPGSQSTDQDAISDKIRKAVLEATRNYSANFGWQLQHYPRGNMLLVNVPVSSTSFEQHVVNTMTGAWCKFTGLNGSCWTLFNDRLYFGGVGGIIYKSDQGTDDDTFSISAIAQTSWNYLGTRDRQKRFTALRPILAADGSISFSSGLGVDFQNINVAQSDSSATGNQSAWDTSPWDTSPWSDEFTVNQNWISADGMGLNVSAKLSILTSTRTVRWMATQYQFEPGRGAY